MNLPAAPVAPRPAAPFRPGRRRVLQAGSAALIAPLAGAGCGSWVTTEPARPMPVIELPAAGPSRTLVVMLPGAGSAARDFVTEGFVPLLQARGHPVHVALPEAGLGYYVWETVLQRLHEDVLQPAFGRGWQVWLVGISLGGFGALACAMRFGAQLQGVLAMAPWLGARALQRDIVAAGGPLFWRAQQASLAAAASELDRELWLWLAAGGAVGARPPIYLSYGRDDRLAGSIGALATLLPPTQVQAVAGDHDWPTWRLLWQQWLARGLLHTEPGATDEGGRSRRIPGRREP